MNAAAEILARQNITYPAEAGDRYTTTCPGCSHKRKKRRDRCLSVQIDRRGVRWCCHHCNWRGWEFYDEERSQVATFAHPAKVSQATTLLKSRGATSNDTALWIWRQRRPIAGTIAERYLREARGYAGPLPATLGFLPARGEHPPAMIAAFGFATEPEPGVLAIGGDGVRGVHLTRLKPDGSGKADADKPKIMLGASSGSPIVLVPPNDLLGLGITEGVEDALSVHQATGLGAWAAGSASRLPKLASAIPDCIECVTILVDDDEAGRRYAADLADRVASRGIEVSLTPPMKQGVAA